MARSTTISMAVIRRLPRYYRFLEELMKKGVTRVSSNELATLLGLTASQIRQDLNCFGGFGQQGYGYLVEQLHEEIGKILGLNHMLDAILVGAGNLGRAVANHLDFGKRGFRLSAVFDHAPELIGKTVRDLPIRSMDELDVFCRTQHPRLAVLCIPKEAAADIVSHLQSLGIQAFWNFSHYDITLEDAIVENVHLGDSLMTLSYRMKHPNE
ncbi:MAG: redox-sensing transcriptional repressor Rex [Clostridia bacterium]|nr:redox-sensing transcriptional repressor Rex [Clostridia bacterium]